MPLFHRKTLSLCRQRGREALPVFRGATRYLHVFARLCARFFASPLRLASRVPVPLLCFWHFLFCGENPLILLYLLGPQAVTAYSPCVFFSFFFFCLKPQARQLLPLQHQLARLHHSPLLLLPQQRLRKKVRVRKDPLLTALLLRPHQLLVWRGPLLRLPLFSLLRAQPLLLSVLLQPNLRKGPLLH